MATGIRYGNPASPPPKPEIPSDWVEHRATNRNPTVAYAWVEILLETTGRDIASVGTPRPTIISRQMSVPLTAMYDAWAAYDEKAVGTRLGGKLRRPAAERTIKNKEKAISYALCVGDTFSQCVCGGPPTPGATCPQMFVCDVNDFPPQNWVEFTMYAGPGWAGLTNRADAGSGD